MAKEKDLSKTQIAPGGIMHTQYELDTHSNVQGLTDEEALTTELPLQREEIVDESHQHGPEDVRDIDSDTKW